MSTPRQCRGCSVALSADAPNGLCTACRAAGGEPTKLPSAPDPNQTVDHFDPALPPEPADIALLFPQLEILGLLGCGGMGAVYTARQPRLDRFVALKILAPRVDDSAFAERFTREGCALARLSHPGIVTVYDAGQAGGLVYLLMEYLKGQTYVRLSGLPT